MPRFLSLVLVLTLAAAPAWSEDITFRLYARDRADETVAWMMSLAASAGGGVKLLAARVDGQTVTVDAVAPNNEEIAAWMGRLEGQPRAQNVCLVSIARERIGGEDWKRYHLTFDVLASGAALGARDQRAMQALVDGFVTPREVPDLLRELVARGKALGLDLVQFDVLPEVSTPAAIEIPIGLKFYGDFDALGRFADVLAQQRRVVHLRGTRLHEPVHRPEGIELTLEATLVLFRALPTDAAPGGLPAYERAKGSDARVMSWSPATASPFADLLNGHHKALRDGVEAEDAAERILLSKGWALWYDPVDRLVCAERGGWDLAAKTTTALLGLVAIHEAAAPTEFTPEWWVRDGDAELPDLPRQPPDYEPVWRGHVKE